MSAMHRTAKKVFTKQARVLRYMRISSGLTQRKTAELLSCSHAMVNHYEQGRLDIPKERVQQLVHLYGYTLTQFEEFVGGKPIPVLDVKDECIGILDRIDESKLRAVHAVLVSFVS
jgi:transcriptional regulator with XRE-family HTH domain